LPQITISYFTSVRAGVESGQRIIAAEEPQVSLRVLAAVVASAVIPVHRFGDDFRSGLARSLAMGIHIVNHQINTAGVDAHLGGGTKELSQVVVPRAAHHDHALSVPEGELGVGNSTFSIRHHHVLDNAK